MTGVLTASLLESPIVVVAMDTGHLPPKGASAAKFGELFNLLVAVLTRYNRFIGINS